MYHEDDVIGATTCLQGKERHTASETLSMGPTSGSTITDMTPLKCQSWYPYQLIYLGFYVTFNTVQVISHRVIVLWAEETSTYSWSRFCTANCRPSVSNYHLSHRPQKWEVCVLQLHHHGPRLLKYKNLEERSLSTRNFSINEIME